MPQMAKASQTPPQPSPSPNPNNGDGVAAGSEGSSSPAASAKKATCPQDLIASVAANVSSQPLQLSDPAVWGVLTAISANARKRRQGINMLLTSDEHRLGRSVGESRFQMESTAVSGKHCKIYRKKIAIGDAGNATFCSSVLLKDTSTNGTYLNWEKLTKTSPEAKVCHGDIISIAAPPHHELAFAFVFREVHYSSCSTDAAILKRKSEEFGSESKRLRGIGIGGPEGPISLDDFRSLQRSNTELRKQVEGHVLTIESLRSDNRAVVERHGNEIKDLKETVSKPYLDQLKELHFSLETKQKELLDVQKITAEQKHAMEDLNERLSASLQSFTEANEIINSQKASISELKAQLDEERDQRKEEREKAEADTKTSVQRAQTEAQEEMKRISDSASRREREQQEVINKLQELDKERCSLAETLRFKLEDTRQKLVNSENKVRQLEALLCEEKQASANKRKRVEELEQEAKELRKELESEKAAREEAWAKVSALELEINAAMRDLDYERRRLKGARERIMLRETQLRAFYSTTEEISVLFAKQQEQLKAMQRTLEAEENYDNVSVDIDLNQSPVCGNLNRTVATENEALASQSNSATKECSGPLTCIRKNRNQHEACSVEASVTEKHDCDMKTQQDGFDTQEADSTSPEQHVKGAFGSEIDGIGTEPVQEGDPIGTERVLETESIGIDTERNMDLNKGYALAGDTMQLDEEVHAEDSDKDVRVISPERIQRSQNNTIEDTEAGGTIRTSDLLASEVVGSWAYSTAPSVHGENESQKCRDDNFENNDLALHDSNAQVDESQSNPYSEAVAAKRLQEQRELSEMIGIIAPDMKEQFAIEVNKGFVSNSDTEGCSNDDEDNGASSEGVSRSGGDNQAPPEDKLDNAMDDDYEDTQQDSVG